MKKKISTRFSLLTSEMIWQARNRAGRCAAADAATRKRRKPSRNPSLPPPAEADAEAKAATKRAARSELADRRAMSKSGVVAMQKAGRKRPPDEVEERSAASSRSFRVCTAREARHSSSTRATSRASRLDSSARAPETAAAGAMVGGMARVSGLGEIGKEDLNSRGGKRSGLVKFLTTGRLTSMRPPRVKYVLFTASKLCVIFYFNENFFTNRPQIFFFLNLDQPRIPIRMTCYMNNMTSPHPYDTRQLCCATKT
jgi:hypothetical protein